MKKIPKSNIVLGFKEFYGEDPPENRLSLIEDISRIHILSELCGLNYRLKPKDEIHTDNSFKRQLTELEYFSPSVEFYNYHLKTLKYFSSSTSEGNIFNRATCLFAIEEILNSSEIKDIPDFDMSQDFVRKSIVRYLISVNTELTKFTENKQEKNLSLEELNPKFIPLNELYVVTDPILILNRGLLLIRFILSNKRYSDELTNYIKEYYNTTPENYISELMAVYFGNINKENTDYEFVYKVEGEFVNIFEKLSNRSISTDTYKLLNIRKSPLIKVNDNKYILADNTFVVHKAYYQLINDFWFDWLKQRKDRDGNKIYTFSNYKGIIGYFVESYISKILSNTFNSRYSKLLLFDDLKINSRKGNYEVADVYYRIGNKILLGQVKSRTVYDKEKYSGNIDTLYNNDRNEFFELFGVNQLVKSIDIMDNSINKIDSKYPINHTRYIYPCIIVNDNALQTPLMHHVFTKRFNELISDIKINKAHVFPLTLIHIDDLEWLESLLQNKPQDLWKILRYHHKNNDIILPFYNTMNMMFKKRAYRDVILDNINNIIKEIKGEG